MKKSEKYAFVGTIVSSVMIVMILLFIYLPGMLKAEEEGMMISFGNAADGGGSEEVVLASVKPEMNEDEDLMTQDEPSVAIVEKKKKPENDLTIQKENARLTSERLKREQDAVEKASAMDGMFGNSGSGGSGSGSGNTNQGNPAGKGSQGGHSWSLNGRDINGDLVNPRYDNNVEGRVSVQIRVDEGGKVIGATIASNTTISDQSTRNAAITAAKNTRFSPGSGISTGIITYNFKLK